MSATISGVRCWVVGAALAAGLTWVALPAAAQAPLGVEAGPSGDRGSSPLINPFGLAGLPPSVFLSKPALADLDGDGDLDLLSGMDSGAFAYAENLAGAGEPPSFGGLQMGPFGLSGFGPTSAPSVADLDGDGDLDVLSGQTFNAVHPPLVYYENAAGGPGPPVFLAEQFNPFGMKSLGNSVVPAVADLDSDGDLDVLTGNFAGAFVYHENTAGPGRPPAFAFAQINPYGLADVGLASAPAVADLDGDGDPDVLSGTAAGGFVFFENVAQPSAPPRFVARRGARLGLRDVGAFSAPAVADLDGDGVLDVLAGEESGDFVFFSGVGAGDVARADAVHSSSSAGARVSPVTPNPARGVARVSLALPQPQRVLATVVDALGREVAVLADGELSGTTDLTVDTARLAAGVYVVRVEGETFAEARRLTVAR